MLTELRQAQETVTAERKLTPQEQAQAARVLIDVATEKILGSSEFGRALQEAVMSNNTPQLAGGDTSGIAFKKGDHYWNVTVFARENDEHSGQESVFNVRDNESGFYNGLITSEKGFKTITVTRYPDRKQDNGQSQRKSLILTHKWRRYRAFTNNDGLPSYPKAEEGYILLVGAQSEPGTKRHIEEARSFLNSY